jgi:hypothetical protein
MPKKTPKTFMEHQEVTLNFLSKALGVPLQITTEDRLRGAIVEALTWMRSGAPGRAIDALENALQLPRK